MDFMHGFEHNQQLWLDLASEKLLMLKGLFGRAAGI